MCIFTALHHQPRVEPRFLAGVISGRVRKYFGNYVFFILGIIFFSMVSIGATPPPQMHSENMLRDSPSVRMIFGALGSQFLFGALGSYNLGALGSLKIWWCVQKLVVSSQNF